MLAFPEHRASDAPAPYGRRAIREKGDEEMSTAGTMQISLVGGAAPPDELEPSEDDVRAMRARKRTRDRLSRENATLREAARRAEEASQRKTEFLANLAHELRTPLTCIVGFAEMLSTDVTGQVSPELGKSLKRILASARHAVGLIEDSLDVARVEMGQITFSPEPVEPAHLVEEVTHVLGGTAAKKEITVRTYVHPELGALYLDPSRLKQVLYNYLSNALKFTPARGSVAVRMVPADTSAVRLEVHDTGIGIAPEDIGRLFVPFQRLHGAAAEVPGTGLGLAVTKRLIEAQGGRVGVRSQPGVGSLFFAELPGSRR